MGLRDPISSASHLFVAVWAGFALLLMMRRTSASLGQRTAVAVFGGSMVLLYLSSGLFHGLPFTNPQQPVEFRFFQRLDQSAIFLLIAGTNTPLMVAFLRGRRRTVYLTSMWGLAGIAVISLWVLPQAQHEVIVASCIAMGWIGMLPLRTYHRAVGWRAMSWIWLGCLLYTVGALCELMQWPVLLVAPTRFGFHETFHILSAAASAMFFLFVLRHVIPAGRTISAGELRPNRNVWKRKPDDFHSLPAFSGRVDVPGNSSRIDRTSGTGHVLEKSQTQLCRTHRPSP